MKPTERIEVRKIYAGSAAAFGLLYGLVLGVIVAVIWIVLFFMGFVFLNTFSLFGSVWLDALAVLIFVVVFVFIVSLLASLFYDLVAKMGGKLHVGLAEHERKSVSAVSKVANKKNVKFVSSTSGPTIRVKK